eukprot:m.179221 g.179221  ORF g.179221 m.179221 type:complete len:72 (-) comp18389_c0_seq1:1659-1874(-)
MKRVDNVNERLVLLEANITAHLKKAKAYFAARDEILSNAMAKKSSTWPNGTKKVMTTAQSSACKRKRSSHL